MTSHNHPQHVLYVTSRFPATTMTFVTNEMTAVEAAGTRVSIATIWKPLDNQQVHEADKALMGRVVPSKKRSYLKHIVAGLRRQPSILSTIASLVPGHLASPWLLAKLLLAIPRGLYFGEWAARNDVDWIHAHFLTSPTTVAMLASKVSGIPYSATAHAFDITSTNPRIQNGSVPEKIDAATAIITISKYNVRDILERWPEVDAGKIWVVYNGIDTAMFHADDDFTPLQDVESRPIRIISVAQLTGKKGFPYLMRAVDEVASRGHDVELAIYGDGPERTALEELQATLSHGDRITLHGSASHTTIATECSRSDIFGLACVPMPSGDADGLPTVLIESLATSIPSISTQLTGIPEIILDQHTGLCVPHSNHQAFADAIEWMIDNPNESQRMAKAGRELVESTFDRNRSAEKLLEIWGGRRRQLATTPGTNKTDKRKES